MVAMLQFTPPINNPIYGTRLITNVKTGMALDDPGGSTVNGKQKIQRVAPIPLARAVRWQQPTAI